MAHNPNRPSDARMPHEQYRWQPKRCNLPSLGQIAASLKPNLRIHIVGDSILLNQYLSLRCIINTYPELFRGWEVYAALRKSGGMGGVGGGGGRTKARPVAHEPATGL
jgi:hypothetical protein